MALALTTADKVRVMRGMSSLSADETALITDLIAEVSDEAEKYMNRATLRKTRSDVFELSVNHRILSLPWMPIVGSVGVQYAPTRDFSAIDSLDTSLYDVLLAEAQIDFRGFTFWYDPGFVQVNCSGGMSETTSLFMAEYPRVAGAVTREVLNRFNRAKNPEGNLQALGTQVAYQKALEPLKDFYAALDHQRRYTL